MANLVDQFRVQRSVGWRQLDRVESTSHVTALEKRLDDFRQAFGAEAVGGELLRRPEALLLHVVREQGRFGSKRQIQQVASQVILVDLKSGTGCIGRVDERHVFIPLEADLQ